MPCHLKIVSTSIFNSWFSIFALNLWHKLCVFYPSKKSFQHQFPSGAEALHTSEQAPSINALSLQLTHLQHLSAVKKKKKKSSIWWCSELQKFNEHASSGRAYVILDDAWSSREEEQNRKCERKMMQKESWKLLAQLEVVISKSGFVVDEQQKKGRHLCRFFFHLPNDLVPWRHNFVFLYVSINRFHICQNGRIHLLYWCIHFSERLSCVIKQNRNSARPWIRFFSFEFICFGNFFHPLFVALFTPFFCGALEGSCFKFATWRCLKLFESKRNLCRDVLEIFMHAVFCVYCVWKLFWSSKRTFLGI